MSNDTLEFLGRIDEPEIRDRLMKQKSSKFRLRCQPGTITGRVALNGTNCYLAGVEPGVMTPASDII
jgi:hypothetical protein